MASTSYAKYSGFTGSSGGGGGSGTVTSVALADGSSTPIFTITGSPVTTSGTLTETLVTQTANTVFSGPTTGAAAQPTFRALVTADLPFSIGNLTDAGTDGITVTGGTGAVIGSGTSLSQHVADTTHNGYLSSTDWNTFNGKQASGNYITALTGDVTASGPGSVAATLAATSNATLTTISSLVSVGTITTGTWNATTIALNHGGTGQTTKAAAFDALSPMTTGGDLIYGGASGTGTRLANGTSGQVLQSNGTTTAPTWTTNISGNAANVTGTVAIGNGGTGQTTKAAGFDALSPMTTGGDIIYGGASGTGTRLANGTAGQVLTSNGTTLAPSWQAVTATSFGTTTTVSSLVGGIQDTTITVTNTNRTIDTTTKDNMVLVSTTTTPSTITLPAPTNGRTLTIKDIGGSAQTNNITIARNGSEKIDGTAASLVLTFNFGFVTLMSDGTDWFVIARSSNITNWASFSPSTQGFGTIANSVFLWRRNGDSLDMNCEFSMGTTTAAEARVNLPSGSVSTLVGTGLGPQVFGRFILDVSGASTLKSGYVLATSGNTFVNFSVGEYTPTNDPANKITSASTIFANNTNIFFQAVSIPISGWGVY